MCYGNYLRILLHLKLVKHYNVYKKKSVPVIYRSRLTERFTVRLAADLLRYQDVKKTP